MRIRQGFGCWVWVGGFALLAACGGSKKDGFIDNAEGGGSGELTTRAGAGGRTGSGSAGKGGGSGGKGGGAGSAGSGGSSGLDGMPTALVPAVEITEPAPASDANRGPVVIDDQVTVLCTAKAAAVSGAKPVDPSTVRIEMLDADGKSLKSFIGVATDNDDEYAAGFTVASLPSGALSFQCSASDTASPARSAVSRVETLLDRGPEITIGEPTDKSAHNLLGAMKVAFTAEPLPIAAGDKQAGVSEVSLLIGGVAFPTVDKGNGEYTASVNFNDKKFFSSPPRGSVPVVIMATDSRKTPGKATRTLSYSIIVDGEGPAVIIAGPPTRAVIGRGSVLTFSVTDSGSGVDRSTIQVTMDSITKTFSTDDGLWSYGTGNDYSFKIGSALAENVSATQVLVNVVATDKAGTTSSGDSHIYNLDNVPPIIDLDPENVYEARLLGSNRQCSEPFDPLGSSPNDLQTIGGYGTFRALVWDLTNSNEQSTYYYAGANRQSVRLYAQAKPESPLLADKDGDGICDEIYTGSIPFQYKPTDEPLPFLALKSVNPMGNPLWSDTSIPAFPGCESGSALAAKALCTTTNISKSDLSVVIRHPVGEMAPFEPVVYAVDPSANETQPLCTGNDWSISTSLGPVGAPKVGWVCLAARGEDNVGNVGISPPLRLCVGASSQNPMPCTTPPPSCTDKCTPPSRFTTRVVRHD